MEKMMNKRGLRRVISFMLSFEMVFANWNLFIKAANDNESEGLAEFGQSLDENRQEYPPLIRTVSPILPSLSNENKQEYPPLIRTVSPILPSSSSTSYASSSDDRVNPQNLCKFKPKEVDLDLELAYMGSNQGEDVLYGYQILEKKVSYKDKLRPWTPMSKSREKRPGGIFNNK